MSPLILMNFEVDLSIEEKVAFHLNGHDEK